MAYLTDANHKTLTKTELLRVVNAASRERFGVSAGRLTAKTRSGLTAKSAEARRLAFAAKYAKR